MKTKRLSKLLATVFNSGHDILLGTIFVSFLVTLFAGCLTHVDAGNVGVEINSCSGGGVSPTSIPVGYHSTGPCTSIVEFPIYMQTMVLTKTATEGSPHDDSISVNDSDGLPINVDVSMSFTIDPAKASAIYTKYRRDIAHIQATFMRQTIREGIQEVFSHYRAEQLYGEAKEKARAEIMKAIVTKLGPDGFVINQFTINEWRFPEQITTAIKSKVAMVQDAQRSEQEVKKKEAEGRQSVAVAKAAAEVSLARSQAEALAIKAKADADAYANEKLTKSLTPTLVEYLKILKWDGKLPQVSGGAGASFITLGTK
jgi:regulator of protease activity HflC (stomatin/prohibitin superfamily)